MLSSHVASNRATLAAFSSPPPPTCPHTLHLELHQELQILTFSYADLFGSLQAWFSSLHIQNP